VADSEAIRKWILNGHRCDIRDICDIGQARRQFVAIVAIVARGGGWN
jgi:hypothetical protein